MPSVMKKRNLDPEQIRAVRHGQGPIMVLAGPGSGKTTVLAHRVFYLHTDQKVPEKEILVLTFTRAAAAEMKNRYLLLKGSAKTGVTFGTFHSVFFRILREQPAVRDFELCERETEIRMIEQIMTDLYGKDFCPGSISGEICDRIGQMKNGMTVTEEMTRKVAPVLERTMNANRLLDYDDILLIFLRLLTDDPEMLRKLRNRYSYILIDEFQDLNRIQYEILKLLSGKEKNVFAVGDDDQSIYGFRGSDPAFMKLFIKEFRTAWFRPVSKVILTANHRSGTEIVKASERLIRHNRERFYKNLKSAGGRGLKPVCLQFETPDDEAAYIEKQVRIITEAYLANHLEEPTFAILGRTNAVLAEVAGLLSPEITQKISAMTFHGSKGLEFDCVFVIGASEGITPDRRASDPGSVEEERRAFYVAMTRAKKYLHIFNTKTVYNKPVKSSRFIKEVFSIFKGAL